MECEADLEVSFAATVKILCGPCLEAWSWSYARLMTKTIEAARIEYVAANPYGLALYVTSFYEG